MTGSRTITAILLQLLVVSVQSSAFTSKDRPDEIHHRRVERVDRVWSELVRQRHTDASWFDERKLCVGNRLPLANDNDNASELNDCLWDVANRVTMRHESPSLDVAATPAPRTHRFGVSHSRSWEIVDRVGDKARRESSDRARRSFSFQIALRQQNLDELEDAFWRVSEPWTSDYGAFWSREKILALIAPPKEDAIVLHLIVAVAAVVCQSDQPRVRHLGDALWVHADACVAESLFDTSLAVYAHHESGARTIRTDRTVGWSWPDAFDDFVFMVTGVADLPPAPKVERPSRHQASTSTVDAEPNNMCNNPFTIKGLYNMSLDYLCVPESSVGAFSIASASEGFGEDGLDSFLVQSGYPSIEKVHIAGAAVANYTSLATDGEATLDVEYLAGMCPGGDVWFWLTDGWMYDWALDIFNVPDSPLVNSASYGQPDVEECDQPLYSTNYCSKYGVSGNLGYINRTNVEFIKLGLNGKTVLASSGDNGAQGDSSPFCNSTAGPMVPNYPATSPYVLSVGGTTLVNTNTADGGGLPPGGPPGVDLPFICTGVPLCNCSTSVVEVPVSASNSGFCSGGGFSILNSMPDYQRDFVVDYLSQNITFPPAGTFNTSQRAFPDVAALGYAIAINGAGGGSWRFIGGTSASTPIWGGIIGTLNSYRLENNLPPLGFVNSLLYQIARDMPEAFNSIGPGDNTCTELRTGCLGFETGSGPYNPVTGLGSGNIGLIQTYIANMDGQVFGARRS